MRAAPTPDPSIDVAGLVIDEPHRFRVDGRVHTDAHLFSLEMQRIWERSWLYVGHESEIRQPGDYRTTVLGRQPIILSRGEDGSIRAMFNRCMHRGAVVCRAERGHANHFRCPYHNWVYRNDGTLVGMAQKSGYGDSFDTSEMNLVAVPRLEVYRGLIFACLDPEVIPLRDRLGPTAWYIDQWADRSPVGRIAVTEGVHRYQYPGNWKFQLENGVDGYHGNYVHESFVKILNRSGDRKQQEVVRTRNRVGSNNCAKGLPHGDGLLEREDGMLGTFDYASLDDYRQALVETHGQDRLADILTQRNILIFPNVYLFESHIRVMRPISPTSTLVDTIPTWIEGIDDALNTRRLREHERFFGPSSFGATDDIEIFVLNQTGVQAEAARWLDFSRGLARERVGKHGERIGHSTDETPQRAMYREWQRRMLVGEEMAS
ncbi:MAG: Rieske 2Fe-2S domain-containing protein [Actinobacteria bacterium]|jgi:phenylpropionate dioxygenase-like ring-hydroxylating dioxygenase large terminal subunit|nr:Rieske 2Fe-2S domain-containing protein [Actinomycetota bacterium]